MTEQHSEAPDARKDDAVDEKPDPGHRADALILALDGSDTGSDTRAGSLRGGSASGSDKDPDQDTINEALAREGMAMSRPSSRPRADPDPIKNTGELTGPSGDPADGKRNRADDDVDAATG